MLLVGLVRKGQVLRVLRRHLQLLFVEEGIVAAKSHTRPYAETRIRLEREIEHEIEIYGSVETVDMNSICRPCPIIITQLEHKMIICPSGERDLAPILFCRSGCNRRDSGNRPGHGSDRIFFLSNS